MRNLDQMEIKMVGKPNGHVFMVGEPGVGKTYAGTRMLEKHVACNGIACVLDYSGSYTKEELEKNAFSVTEQTEIRDMGAGPIIWEACFKKKELFCDAIVDTLMNILKISSYYQKKWLKKAVYLQMEKREIFCIAYLEFVVEQMVEKAIAEKASKDDVDNLKRLLSRLMPYERLLRFGMKYVEERHTEKSLVIFQLSERPLFERKFVTAFLLEMMWAETVHMGKAPFDCIGLDECHFLELSTNSVVEVMMREGRRFGLALMFATQFIQGKDLKELNVLLLAGTLLIFRPTAKESHFWAEIIDRDKKNEWVHILRSLPIGEAVLIGKYTIGENLAELGEPIIVTI